jgi:hypothetical protein
VNFSWPAEPLEILTWAEVMLVWAIANYLVAPDPAGREAIHQVLEGQRLLMWKRDLTRSVAVSLATFVIVGWNFTGSLLAFIAFSATVVLSLGRRFLVARKLERAPEFEIALNVLFLLGTAWIVEHNQLKPALVLLSVPLSENRLAVIMISASVFIFAGQGGTHIVRGILDRVGAIPKTDGIDGSDDSVVQSVDTDEYNRGQVIGNLERYLLLLAVVLGTYAALGFLVAAKGLIRFEKLKDRVFAEYFLIGTLSSVGVALMLGLLLRWSILTLW